MAATDRQVLTVSIIMAATDRQVLTVGIIMAATDRQVLIENILVPQPSLDTKYPVKTCL